MRKLIFVVFLFGVFLCVNALDYPISRNNPWADDYTSISARKNYRSWGTYNVHDPAIMKVGDTYYMYSTDAIYRNSRPDEEDRKIKEGNIQVRSSKDLVNWKFIGWALDSIPVQAKQWVLEQANGKGATNIWAPFPVIVKSPSYPAQSETQKFRLYYCVSAFGLQTSYIGMLESDSPLGPWEDKACVVKTMKGDKMNAIDPSVITDTQGRQWMHYGSYFGGLYAVELDPQTGLTKVKGDQGHLIARRANYRRDNLEAPEIMYNPITEYYYLFMSYEPLMTTYNIRVGRSRTVDGPFLDFFGNELKDTTNNYPILTYPYQFENHSGWAGTGHCGVIDDGKGKLYLAHQGRLSPEHHLMDLHIREIFWTKNGWPVLSPERYAGDLNLTTEKCGDTGSEIQFDHVTQISGEWEVIYISDSPIERGLEYGQILWGENKLQKHEFNPSFRINVTTRRKNKTAGKGFKGDFNSAHLDWNGKWKYSTESGLELITKKFTIQDIKVFVGQDWENQKQTLLFTGLDENGRSLWGKKVK